MCREWGCIRVAVAMNEVVRSVLALLLCECLLKDGMSDAWTCDL